jgi:hypothetical protein
VNRELYRDYKVCNVEIASFTKMPRGSWMHTFIGTLFLRVVSAPSFRASYSPLSIIFLPLLRGRIEVGVKGRPGIHFKIQLTPVRYAQGVTHSSTLRTQ